MKGPSMDQVEDSPHSYREDKVVALRLRPRRGRVRMDQEILHLDERAIAHTHLHLRQ
jgi:hypothetical protein